MSLARVTPLFLCSLVSCARWQLIGDLKPQWTRKTRVAPKKKKKTNQKTRVFCFVRERFRVIREKKNNPGGEEVALSFFSATVSEGCGAPRAKIVRSTQFLSVSFVVYIYIYLVHETFHPTFQFCFSPQNSFWERDLKLSN